MKPPLATSTDFVGREEQIGQFRQLVQQHLFSKRLAKLGYFGIGGIGKSRLLAELAQISRTDPLCGGVELRPG